MRRERRPAAAARLLGALGLLALAFLWLAAGPAVLGGSATYLMVSGTSMLPHFHAGDLVVVRRAQTYRVGDVAAYRNRQLGVVVLHRIVALDAERLVFQGDHNAWRDAYEPGPGEVLGKLWLHLPGAGRWLQQIRTPGVTGVLVGGLTMALVAGEAGQQALRRKKRRLWGRPAGAGGGGGWGRGASARLLYAGAAFVLLVLLAWAAWAVPPVRSATLPAEYRQSGGFVYTASATPGPVYPDGRVKTGDPVFLNLTHVVRFTFDYRFQSAFPHRISGRAFLTAVLQGSSGWSRSFPLQPETTFQGDEIRLQGSLDLARLAEIVAQLQAATGLENEQYKLILEPHVQAAGLLGGSALAAGFDPQLSFNFTPVMLSPVTSAPGGSGADPFRPAETSTVALAREAPATLGLGRLQIPVEGLRLAMPATLLLALAALVLSWLQFLHEGRRPEPERIRALYGDLLAEARDLGLAERPRVVWVADMASLARLAAQYERLVLHQEVPDGSHLYAVEDTDCVYCYRTGSWLDGAGSFPAGEASPAQPASEVHP